MSNGNNSLGSIDDDNYFADLHKFGLIDKVKDPNDPNAHFEAYFPDDLQNQDEILRKEASSLVVTKKEYEKLKKCCLRCGAPKIN